MDSTNSSTKNSGTFAPLRGAPTRWFWRVASEIRGSSCSSGLSGMTRSIRRQQATAMYLQENCFLRRKRCQIVERCNREVDRVGIFTVFENQIRAAKRSKRTDPSWRAAFPFQVRRTRTFLAIGLTDANGRLFNTKRAAPANASTSEAHNSVSTAAQAVARFRSDRVSGSHRDSRRTSARPGRW